jgi:iron complex transport system ATP-binding protein
MVLVTHHVEEIPSGFTHAMLLRHGAVVAQGPMEYVMTADNLSKSFGVPLGLDKTAAGRWYARPV